MLEKILQDAHFVHEHSQDVVIHEDAIDTFVKDFVPGEFWLKSNLFHVLDMSLRDLISFLLVYHTTVSYTHLDVYKRQIEDDVTARSLPYEDLHIRTQSVGFLVYGYGSDGMVSAGKDIMKITGGYTNAFVQGYFQYDSKKSGGVTIGHLRFGKEPIRSTYYVENPDVVVLTKDSYLQKYEMLNKIKNHGIFLINTTKNADELNDALTDHDKEILKNRNIKIYYLDAEKIAESVGLGRKISAIMETVIFKVTKLIDFDFAKEHIKEGIHKKFDKKGNQIAEKNIAAIDKALEDLHVLDYNDLDLSGHEEEKDHSLFAMIDRRLGDSLPVSAFKDTADGTFEAGTTRPVSYTHLDVYKRQGY